MSSAGRWGKLAYIQIQDDGRPQHEVPKLMKRVFKVFVFKKFAITFHGPVLNALYIGLRANARGQLPFHFAITELPLPSPISQIPTLACETATGAEKR